MVANVLGNPPPSSHFGQKSSVLILCCAVLLGTWYLVFGRQQRKLVQGTFSLVHVDMPLWRVGNKVFQKGVVDGIRYFFVPVASGMSFPISSAVNILLLAVSHQVVILRA